MLRRLRAMFSGKSQSLPPTPRRRLSVDVALNPRIYAIGDIHGRLDLLLDLEKKIEEDARDWQGPKILLPLGDMVDRGSQSAQVINHLLKPAPEGFTRLCLCGNHDDAFLNFILAPEAHLQWLEFGGRETLLSYGVDARRLLKDGGGRATLFEAARSAVPEAHLQFLRSLPVSLSFGNFLFVHAGIMPGIPISEQSDLDLMWMREPFITEGSGMSNVVVHGHTPSPCPSHAPGRVGIDTGAYMTDCLTALRVDGDGSKFIFAGKAA